MAMEFLDQLKSRLNTQIFFLIRIQMNTSDRLPCPISNIFIQYFVSKKKICASSDWIPIRGRVNFSLFTGWRTLVPVTVFRISLKLTQHIDLRFFLDVGSANCIGTGDGWVIFTLSFLLRWMIVNYLIKNLCSVGLLTEILLSCELENWYREHNAFFFTFRVLASTSVRLFILPKHIKTN